MRVVIFRALLTQTAPCDRRLVAVVKIALDRPPQRRGRTPYRLSPPSRGKIHRDLNDLAEKARPAKEARVARDALSFHIGNKQAAHRSDTICALDRVQGATK